MKIPGFNCKVTFDSVVLFHKKKEIEDIAKGLAGGAESSRIWIRYYQGAKKQVKENLTDTEYDEYTRELEEWKKKGVPLEVQIT